jgi:hypothetical protein
MTIDNDVRDSFEPRLRDLVRALVEWNEFALPGVVRARRSMTGS